MPGSADAQPGPAGVLVRGNRSFRSYWAGEATSLAGSSLHAVALPVVAVLELNATPSQVSLLAAAAMTPAFVLALPAGVVGDRYAKKPVMVGTDLAAAAVVASVPACWAVGMLSVPVLYAVALLLGALTVLHQAASIAIVPELVEREKLPAANSRIAAAYSVADTSGTYGGTFVVGLAGAVHALWLDSVSYIFSAWCALQVRPVTPPKPTASHHARMIDAIREGVGFVMRDPLQRPLVLALTCHAYADGIVTTYFAYTLLTELDAGSTGLGLVMGVSGAGGLVGALAAPRLVARLGPGRVLLTGFLGYPACGVPLLLAQPEPAWLAGLAVAGAVRTAAAAAAGSTQRSIRQQQCPAHLQARAQQTSVWLVSGLRPFAALTAGSIAAVFGVWASLLVGTVLYLVPAALLWASPIRHLAKMPGPPTDPPPPPAACRQPTPTEDDHHVH
ncbi:MFS transporter [Streptomyces sp. NPDC093589]|uniref:MFS transporter n=1 Tax=Streptomyces sp. NPDC093589 TaxID=3366043 RepID=UPI00382A4E44